MKLFPDSKSSFLWKGISQLFRGSCGSFSVMVFFVLIIGTTSPLFSQIMWTKDSNPLPLNGASGTWNRHVVMPCVLYNPDSSRYEMWFAAGFDSFRPYRIGFATSPDGINWNYIHPTPVLEPTPGSWDESTVEDPMVLRENGGQYKMWYTGWSPSNLPGKIGYATSPDGIQWTKDTLNNPVLEGTHAWEPGGPTSGTVMADPGGGYKMWYAGWNAAYTSAKIGYATSPDGITWTKDPNNPVLGPGTTGEWDDAWIAQPGVFILNSMYYMLYSSEYSGGNPLLRQIGLATSPDGIIWTKYDDPGTTSPPFSQSDPVLSPSAGQWDQHAVEGPFTLLIDGTLHTWYNGSTHPTNTYLWRIGHATSPITINVPGVVATIQGAIDIASDGNIVLVDDGTYYENINFKGKAITVASRFLLDGDTSHISNTIIDGSQPSHPDSGSVVSFISGEDTSSVLCGFTITGGTGTIVNSFNAKCGGGIFVFNSGAKIENNHIGFNAINRNDDGYGGGIFAHDEFDDHNFIIENNRVHNNSIATPIVTNYSLAAGVYTHTYGAGLVRISGNYIVDNTITAPTAYGCGLGSYRGGTATHIIKDNIISGNVIMANSGSGGGIDLINYLPYLHNNVFSNNSATVGGGIHLEWNLAKAKATPMRGGKTTKQKEGIDLQTHLINLLSLSNNTVVGNSATVSGGGIQIIGPTIHTAMNFIVWGNTAPTGPQISGFIDIRNSDIEGGYQGEGNIDADPQFISGDPLFHLTPDSLNPCVNTGADSIQISGQWYYCSSNDYEGDERPYMGRLPDMGADETQVPPPPIVGIEPQPAAGIPQSYALEQNYPNPFNPSTNIEFSIPKSEFVTLKVYNILGEEVATLVSERLATGKYKYDWDAGSLASGVYLYWIQAGNYSETRKMILLR